MSKLSIPTLPGASFLSFGATSMVLKFDDTYNLVLKVPREPGSELFAQEVEIWKLLGVPPMCPDIVPCFFVSPQTIFLSFCSGGTLDQRIRQNQQREPLQSHRTKLVTVVRKEPQDLIERWIMELTSAAAWLESFGLVHTDIRPPNLLLDDQDHLKLADFDNAAKIGSMAGGGASPWARRISAEERKRERHTFGLNGPRVEQFAIGSVLYTMTRGHAPYDDGFTERGPILGTMFENRDLPPLDDDTVVLDKIIRCCWWNRYVTLQDLANETKLLPGATNLPRASLLEESVLVAKGDYCKKMVEDGLQWGKPLEPVKPK